MRQPVIPVVLFLAITLLATGVAQATCTCEGVENCLGVYFDEGAWNQTCREQAPYAIYHMYFVLQNVPFAAISGIEFAWRMDPEPSTRPIVLNALFFWPGIEWSDPRNVIVGIGTPVPIEGPIPVLDLTLIDLSTYATSIMLGPATPATIPGHAAINDWYQPEHVVPINFPCPVGPDGWTIEGVAEIGHCPVATETTVWGAVKALYR